ncbi:conjugal transfer protein TraF [mine drainage metagenome]|uniref:Conjugal transfer protein TraF n=1 Tax=mine drainage metagenome TaxID=410659 RepID=T1BQ06_9ZZZZ
MMRIFTLACALTVAPTAGLLVAKYYGWTLYINTTASMPEGIYLVRTRGYTLRVHEPVVFRPPARIRALVYGQGWLKPGAPLIKHVGVLPGGRYCALDGALHARSWPRLPIARQYAPGRPLPHIHGCHIVQPNAFLPLSDLIPNSFDGRYFGSVSDSSIIGTARPIFVLK